VKTAEKKRLLSRYGKITLHTEHDYYTDNQSFGITPYMQDLLIVAGKDDNYLAAEKRILRYLRVLANDSQINRLCQHYGEKLEEQTTQMDSVIEQKAKNIASELGNEEVVYAMSDGSMIFTREDKGSWKEMKLGRIFTQSNHFELGKKANIIRESLYVSHFGGHEKFSEKFEAVVDCYESIGERLVFINDGASWINNWIKSNYPKATNILDYYHAVEYIHDFSKAIWSDKEKRKKWSDAQSVLLLEDKATAVIENINEIAVRGKVKTAAKDKILSYYNNNHDRMLYKTYRQRGLLIGSGPIESAHRFVLQKRLKQSGQKWTISGAQAVTNLRIAGLNNMWDNVVKMYGQAA
jgi:hypothetical protein